MTTLLQTDCSRLTTTDIVAHFDEITETLFNDYLLQVNDAKYRLLEVEFYLYSKNHPDIYVHQNDEQLKSNTWYFHGSGLDITFGGDNCHGGILIRAIKKVTDTSKDPNPIFEPLNVVRALFSKFQTPFGGQANIFGFVPVGNVTSDWREDVIKAPRIGLNPKKEGGANFVDKHYRYIIFPALKHKEKTKIALAMQQQGRKIETINKLLGSKFLKT